MLLGITFEENCRDVRNTRIVDAIRKLKEYDANVLIYDPWGNPGEFHHEYGLDIETKLPMVKFDAVVLAVAHKDFEGLDFSASTQNNGVCYKLRG